MATCSEARYMNFSGPSKLLSIKYWNHPVILMWRQPILFSFSSLAVAAFSCCCTATQLLCYCSAGATIDVLQPPLTTQFFPHLRQMSDWLVRQLDHYQPTKYPDWPLHPWPWPWSLDLPSSMCSVLSLYLPFNRCSMVFPSKHLPLPNPSPSSLRVFHLSLMKPFNNILTLQAFLWYSSPAIGVDLVRIRRLCSSTWWARFNPQNLGLLTPIFILKPLRNSTSGRSQRPHSSAMGRWLRMSWVLCPNMYSWMRWSSTCHRLSYEREELSTCALLGFQYSITVQKLSLIAISILNRVDWRLPRIEWKV